MRRPPALLLAALAWNAYAAIPTATLKLEGGATLAVAPAASAPLAPVKSASIACNLKMGRRLRMAATPGREVANAYEGTASPCWRRDRRTAP